MNFIYFTYKYIHKNNEARLHSLFLFVLTRERNNMNSKKEINSTVAFFLRADRKVYNNPSNFSL